MLREIIKPVSDTYSLHIPEEYINKEVEILVRPFKNSENRVAKKSFKDLLSTVAEGLSDDDLKRQNDYGRE